MRANTDSMLMFDTYEGVGSYSTQPGGGADLSAQPVDNLSENVSAEKNPGTLYTLLLLTILYAFLGWWEGRGIGREFRPGEIKVTLFNFFKITLAVVIGVNLLNIFFTKLAAMRIPLLSRLAGMLMPLFSF